jgi:hypothetical protein
MSQFKSYTTTWGSKVAILKTKAGSIVADLSENAERLTFGEYADATHADVREAMDAATAEIYLALMGPEPIDVVVTEPTTDVTPDAAGKDNKPTLKGKKTAPVTEIEPTTDVTPDETK